MEDSEEVIISTATDNSVTVRKSRSKLSRSVILSRVGVTVLAYPIEFVKTLMQIGYEPLEPVSSFTLLGRQCLLLPNSFNYIKYVKRIDGFLGCFRGLGPRLVQQSAFLYSSHVMRNIIIRYHERSDAEKPEREDLVSPAHSVVDDSIESDLIVETSSECSCEEEGDPVTLKACWRALCEDWCCRIVGIVVSFPFQVIAVRTVAEFVGRENNFSGNVLHGILQIYSQDGIAGFFKGLMPKLVGDTIHLFTCGVLRYLVRTQVCCEELRACMSFSISILVGSLTYPFIVVSNTMIVSGVKNLAVGNPPLMCTYASWYDCWNHLSALNQLRRGSSLFFRYYTGPRKLTASGKLVPDGVKFGPDLRK